MKRKVRDIGIVYRIINYGESSVILNAACKNSGFISIIAKGIRAKDKSIALTLLNEYEFNLYEPSEGGLYLLSESSCLLEYEATTSPSRMAAALAGLEFISHIIAEAHEYPLYYDLVRNYLQYLQTIEKNHVAILWRLMIRTYKLLGIDLDITKCYQCHVADVHAFERGNLNLLCKKCIEDFGAWDRVTEFGEEARTILQLLPQIGKHIHQINPSRSTVKELDGFFLAYFEHHFQKVLKLKSLSVLEQYYL
jgi:DNA repair protein RecO